MTRSEERGPAVRVTPRGSLMRNGALSFLFISLALFGSLYFLAIPLGTWPSVLALHLIMTAAFVVALLRYRSTSVSVADRNLEYHGFLRAKWTVPIEEIDTVTIVQIYRSNAPDASLQLLARNAEGARVLRMRALFWHESDIRGVAEALGRPVDINREPMTTKEFLEAYPGGAFWFEGHPALIAAAAALVLIAALSIVLGLMALTGVSIGLS